MSAYALEICTRERIVYAHNVTFVSVRAVDGVLGITSKHIPLITTLRVAPVVIADEDGRKETYAVHGGILHIAKNHVIILADEAERAGDIDVARAQRAQQRAQQRLAERAEHIDFARAERALARALSRIEAKNDQ
jgi:F-type H+-transporting ATPase subunit epsilon